MRNGHRLLVVATHPVQYQGPLWRTLAAVPGVVTKVLFLSDFSVRGYRDAEFNVDVRWTTPLLDGYDHEFLSHGPCHSAWSAGPAGLGAVVAAFAPTAVLVNGFVPLFYQRAALIARRLNARVLYRGEATDSAVARGFVKAWVRDRLLQRFYGGIDVFLSIGTHALAHYRRLGVPPKRIVSSPYCIDTDHFAASARQWLPKRQEVRNDLRIPAEGMAVLFSGKLIPKKDPEILIRAADRVRERTGLRPTVIFMGDGHLRTRVEQLASTLGVDARFVGFQSQETVGRYLAAADVLVLPSVFGETWGLVVNEALQFGLPAIVSDRVGCAPDLIISGQTGEIFPAGDVVALADRLGQMSRALAAGEACRYRQACERLIATHTLQHAAAGVVEAMRTRVCSQHDWEIT